MFYNFVNVLSLYFVNTLGNELSATCVKWQTSVKIAGLIPVVEQMFLYDLQIFASSSIRREFITFWVHIGTTYVLVVLTYFHTWSQKSTRRLISGLYYKPNLVWGQMALQY